jgi:hypothetical protein
MRSPKAAEVLKFVRTLYFSGVGGVQLEVSTASAET